MIGPHQGKELEFMLAGRKHLAIFYDVLPDDEDIPEEIIPEKAFASYVEKGIMTRISKDYSHPQGHARYVCFTTQGEEWRAIAFLWMHQECISGRRPFDDAYEFFVGRLLGYEEEDIRHFIDHLNHTIRKKA